MHSRPGRPCVALLLAALLLVTAGCGDAIEPGSNQGPPTGSRGGSDNLGITSDSASPEAAVRQPDLGRPDDILDTTTGPPMAGDVLDLIEPLDQGPAPDEVVGIRDGRTRNEAGEPYRLDQPAALACSDVERALSATDDGPTVADRVGSAADRAGRSTIDDVVAWAPALTDLAAGIEAGSADTATEASVTRSDAVGLLVGFLSACTRGGYEL